MNNDHYLFVSDLHLDASLPPAVDQFLTFLDGPARAACGLYILGDLFEAWVGDDDLDECRASVCAALRRYTDSGLPCHVVRGNRDFLLGSAFEARTGCRLLPDPVLLQLGELRVFVCHGDLLCRDDVAYQQLRSIVRQSRWQKAFLALDLATRRVLAGAARKGSQAHTSRAGYRIMDVNPQAVAAGFRVSDARLMIHGHTHRPGIHDETVDGQAATRIVLGDWYTQGSCLRLYSDGRYELEALPRD